MNENIDSIDLSYALIEKAKSFVGIHEQGGDNRGPQVDEFEEAIDNTIGHAWCADFVGFCIKQVEEDCGCKSGLILSSSVVTIWTKNPKRQIKGITEIYPGDLIVWSRGDGTGHIGVFIGINATGQMITVEGNTSPEEKTVVREGDGVYKKTRNFGKIGTMQLLGFLRVFV